MKVSKAERRTERSRGERMERKEDLLVPNFCADKRDLE